MNALVSIVDDCSNQFLSLMYEDNWKKTSESTIANENHFECSDVPFCSSSSSSLTS